MARRFFTFFLLCFFILLKANAAQPRNLLQHAADINMVKKLLLPKESWVPYPAYTDRQGWARLLGSQQEALIKKGEKALQYQWLVIRVTDYVEYQRSGARVVMENPYNANLSAITSLFLAEMAEGKGRFMDQLCNGIFAACEMTSWSISAHLALQKNNLGLPDKNQQIIELVSGDVGAMFSWMYYFLHKEMDKVNPMLAQRLKQEITARILKTYMSHNDFWWMGLQRDNTHTINNWNPWCNCNVLQAFALMEDNKDSLAAAVYKTMVSVDQFINYNKDDGACEEGPSYWGHAAGKMYDYLQMLYDMTGGKISIFNQPLIKKMGEYISRSYVGNEWVVNFADASARSSGDAGLVYRYGKAVHSAEMQAFAAALLHTSVQPEAVSGRDMFRTLQGFLYNKELDPAKAALPQVPYTWYPQTEVCFIKNSRFFFAGKGGHNNESHNHNDIGTFSVYIQSIPFFIDAGVGTYTRQTFGPERYTIWTMQSNYHNLPVINGASQQPGAAYKSRNIIFDPVQQTLSMDISQAYGSNATVKYWYRKFSVGADSVVVQDSFMLTKRQAADTLNFLTWARPDISVPGMAKVQKNGVTAVLKYDAGLFTPQIDTVPLSDKRLTDVWGSAIYRLSLIAKKSLPGGTYRYVIYQAQ